MNKEEAIKYLQQLYPNGGHCWLDEQRMEAIGMAIQALQEEHVNEDLEEASVEWFNSVKYKSDLSGTPINAFKAGAQWQEKQDQSIIELAEDHAMLAGMEKMREQLMKDAVEVPLYSDGDFLTVDYDFSHEGFKAGDKVKLVIIKED